MFEKFGKMDYEELIRTAAAEREEGDLESLITLALENGLEEEDAEDYMDRIAEEFATPYMAAVAKIEAEAKELDIRGHQTDLKDLVLMLLIGEENKEMCLAVRKKDKSLTECLAKILTFSTEHITKVPDEIVKLARFKGNGKDEPMRSPVLEGGGTKTEFKKIIREYYLEA